MEKENEKVAILPFTENNLKKALNESKYLFIASHGFDGLVFSGPEKFYTYMDFAHYKMSKLEFIYFSACQLGVNYYSEYWQRILSPAKVVLFDRDSAIMEHVIWMLFNSIEAVKEVNENQDSEYEQEVSLIYENIILNCYSLQISQGQPI